MKIKYLLYFFISNFIVCKNFAQHQFNNTTIYLVRHAEKDTGLNPMLTKAGKVRSGDLYTLLKDKNISHIYTTDYKRTKMTADSLRIYLKIDTIIYKMDSSCSDLIQKIIENNDLHKPILIIGHSNTIPQIINIFSHKKYGNFKIEDNQYNLFSTLIFKRKKCLLTQFEYGK